MGSPEKKVFYQLIIDEIIIEDKKVKAIKLNIDEEVQEDIRQKALSDKDKSDRVIFMDKIQGGISVSI